MRSRIRYQEFDTTQDQLKIVNELLDTLNSALDRIAVLEKKLTKEPAKIKEPIAVVEKVKKVVKEKTKKGAKK